MTWRAISARTAARLALAIRRDPRGDQLFHAARNPRLPFLVRRDEANFFLTSLFTIKNGRPRYSDVPKALTARGSVEKT